MRKTFEDKRKVGWRSLAGGVVALALLVGAAVPAHAAKLAVGGDVN